MNINGQYPIIRPRFGLTPEQEQDVMDKAKKLLAGAKNLRAEYEPDLRELGRYFIPHLVRFDESTKTKKSKWSNIINNTCRMSVRTLAAGMQSGLTSPARPWARIGLEDFEMMEYQPAKDWLEIVQNRMMTIFRRSNFYNTSHMLYGVLGTTGTAGRLHLFDYEDVMNFQNLMTGRYWIGINHKKRVDKVFIEMMMTVDQQVQMFKEKVDPKTRAKFDRGDYFEEEKVMLAIFPNPHAGWDMTGRKLIASNQKPFVSVYWKESHDKPLRTSGFDRFPAQVPRWEVTDDEAYGVGCGIDALGDNKAIQLKEREKAKGIQKMVNPPVSAPAEMRTGQFPISGLPGGVTYRPPSSDADSVRSLYQVNLPLNYLYEDIRIDEDRVKRAFFADLFLMMAQTDRRQITATEVAERHEEKLLALGPVIENVGNEFLDPSIERSFEIMMDNELVPPPPPEIQGQNLKIEYISILSQAQQQVGIGSIERYMSFVGRAAAIFPEATDKVDVYNACDDVATMLGVPSRIVVPDDKAKAKREGINQQAAQAQQMQMGAAAVDAAEKLGKTPLGDTNVLSQMMGV